MINFLGYFIEGRGVGCLNVMGCTHSYKVRKNYALFKTYVDHKLKDTGRLALASPVFENGSLKRVNFPSKMSRRWVIWDEVPCYVVDCQGLLNHRLNPDEIRTISSKAVVGFCEQMRNCRGFDPSGYFAWLCYRGQILMYRTVTTRRIDCPWGKYDTF
jgi:hypothetical protein